MGIVGKIVIAVIIAVLSSGFDTEYHERNKNVVRTVHHVVTEGETLWGIGERYYDGSAPLNEWMSALRKANGFDAGSGRKYLHPGEIVLVRTTLAEGAEK